MRSEERHQLYQRLVETIGEEAASTLMSSLPPDRWDELARKADIEALEQRFDGLETRFDGLEGRFDKLEGRLDGVDGRFDGHTNRFDAIEGRIESLRGEVRAEVGAIREVLDARLDAMRNEVLAALHAQITVAMTAQTRVMLFTMAGALVGLAGLAMALGRLG